MKIISSLKTSPALLKKIKTKSPTNLIPKKIQNIFKKTSKEGIDSKGFLFTHNISTDNTSSDMGLIPFVAKRTINLEENHYSNLLLRMQEDLGENYLKKVLMQVGWSEKCGLCNKETFQRIKSLQEIKLKAVNKKKYQELRQTNLSNEYESLLTITENLLLEEKRVWKTIVSSNADYAKLDENIENDNDVPNYSPAAKERILDNVVKDFHGDPIILETLEKHVLQQSSSNLSFLMAIEYLPFAIRYKPDIPRILFLQTIIASHVFKQSSDTPGHSVLTWVNQSALQHILELPKDDGNISLAAESHFYEQLSNVLFSNEEASFDAEMFQTLMTELVDKIQPILNNPPKHLSSEQNSVFITDILSQIIDTVCACPPEDEIFQSFVSNIILLVNNLDNPSDSIRALKKSILTSIAKSPKTPTNNLPELLNIFSQSFGDNPLYFTDFQLFNLLLDLSKHQSNFSEQMNYDVVFSRLRAYVNNLQERKEVEEAFPRLWKHIDSLVADLAKKSPKKCYSLFNKNVKNTSLNNRYSWTKAYTNHYRAQYLFILSKSLLKKGHVISASKALATSTRLKIQEITIRLLSSPTKMVIDLSKKADRFFDRHEDPIIIPTIIVLYLCFLAGAATLAAEAHVAFPIAFFSFDVAIALLIISGMITRKMVRALHPFLEQRSMHHIPSTLEPVR